MAKRIKFKQIKFGNYFRELSIVIIGVAITLATSSIINSIQEKKDLKLQMNAIYTELEDNLEKVRKLDNYYQDTRKLQHYLMKDYHSPGTEYVDSIRSLNKIVGRSITFVYKRNAYEMFINSGGMKTFSNKKTLLDITECYSLLEGLSHSHKEYMGFIVDFIKSLYHMDTHKLVDKMDIREFKALYNFHLMSSGDYEKSGDTIEMIENILAKR